MSVVRRILLVDDEADPRYTLAEQLKLHDSFEMETAGDGAGAIEAAKVGPFDAILLDVGLPDMDGREVCRALCRAGVAEPPIIALRGGHSATALIRCSRIWNCSSYPVNGRRLSDGMVAARRRL